MKAFAEAKVIGIKYYLFARESSNRTRTGAKAVKTAKPPSKVPRPVLKGTKKPITDKVIPFVSDDQENQTQEDEDQLKAYVQKAIHALEKGNSVAAYNLLKRIIS